MRLGAMEAAGEPPPAEAVILVDKRGVLSSLYQIASVAFIGGSLIPHGGQNVMEPAGLGGPPVVGPHTLNFKDVRRDLQAAGGLRRVPDAPALGAALDDLFADAQARTAMGAAGRRVIIEGRGATGRNLELIRSRVDMR